MKCMCLFVLAAISALSVADSVFDFKECGPNNYEGLLQRPTVGRLLEFPWLARLGFRRNGELEFNFQGTLIHPYYVLTTTVATDYYQDGLELVRLGDYHRSTDEDCQEIADDMVCAPPPQDITIERVIRHPNLESESTNLALVKLFQPANISADFVKPICIPTENNFPLNEYAPLFIEAWCGSERSGISDVPLQYRMQMISLSRCAEKLSNFISTNLYESQFCAVLDLDAKAKNRSTSVSLRGSTGAPVHMLGQDGRTYQVGVMSIGVRNAPLDAPYVFVNVIKAAGWLVETVTQEEENRVFKRVQ